MPTLNDILEQRRSSYALQAKSPISDDQIEGILKTALWNLPSAFNSQSSRFLLLLGKEHIALWQIVKDVLKAKIPAEAFAKTEAKIDHCFAGGYGTVLYFEDNTVIEGLQRTFPTYSEGFPIFAQQTSGLHQLAVWLLFTEAGLSASLQHYNPLIDAEVRKRWNVPEQWQHIAQMPFGTAVQPADPKEHLAVEERIKVFGK